MQLTERRRTSGQAQARPPRKTLRLLPGDKLAFEVEGRTLKLRPSRPDMLATLLAHQFRDSTMTGATASVRRDRGWDDKE